MIFFSPTLLWLKRFTDTQLQKISSFCHTDKYFTFFFFFLFFVRLEKENSFSLNEVVLLRLKASLLCQLMPLKVLVSASKNLKRLKNIHPETLGRWLWCSFCYGEELAGRANPYWTSFIHKVIFSLFFLSEVAKKGCKHLLERLN